VVTSLKIVRNYERLTFISALTYVRHQINVEATEKNNAYKNKKHNYNISLFFLHPSLHVSSGIFILKIEPIRFVVTILNSKNKIRKELPRDIFLI